MKFIPYSICQDSEISKGFFTKSELFSSEILVEYPELLKIISEDSKRAEELQGGYHIAGVQAFAGDMEILSNKYDCQPLTEWAKAVENAADNIELEQIQLLMDQFLKVIKSV